ncbi:Pkinase-domain-containing protein [Zopfia rhizophila CBS 207.26]|uniref:non-specific serine/threonine protein kinase n=1 Tax=Zopfia rhizophila CBS 207.26 TaxID=1314779 RepID=A0A6A6EFQ9_9PEZI|nr:Pkinase-domain-containing protein [Zopfia rhizophila CBS 207.26]
MVHPHGRPPTRRRALGDAMLRANEDAGSQRRSGPKSNMEDVASSPNHLPHNESLVPNGTLAVRHPQPSPENKHISAVTNDEQHNTKRDSEISNASTNASSTNRRRKTHIGPWQLGKTIGRGGCSRVRIVRHSITGEYGAAKIISKAMAEKVRALSLANLIKSAEEEQSMFPGGKVIPFGLEREIVIMRLLEHDNIVRLYDVWENRNELYVIMEYIQGGELFHYIGETGGLREIEVVHLFRQIIAALLYCHRLNIHHRDLKPENILLDRTAGKIKLVDFGMAALQPEGMKLSTPCGSPHYAAPEVIRFRSYDGGKADVWSCGVILYVMLTGTPPFNYSGDDRDLKNLFHAIAHADYVMPDMLSRDAQDLIRRILVPDPKRRISIEQIWYHPFLHKYDVQLDFQDGRATFEAWIGPLPRISNWKQLERKTIDREILRNLRTLWHSEKEEVIVQRLLNNEANQEKYFYSALLRHREESLENYVPNPNAVAYSNSDHHHYTKTDPSTDDLLQLPCNKHKRTQSGYSVLNDEHLCSKHSFYEPPSSDASYDPFRASREPIIPGQAPHRNVAVFRGSKSGSRKLRPVTALGHRTGSSLRIQALRNSNRRSSGLSANPSKRSTLSQSSSATKRRSVSRSSIISSQWPSSPPIIVKPSSMAKRGVSFSYLRRSSTTSAFTNKTAAPQCTPEQRKFLTRSRDCAASSTASPRPIMQPAYTAHHVSKTAASPNIPRLRIRKPESPSKYIQNEARKVSTELEKVMEEAFNRSSIGSSIRTTATGGKKDAPEYDTPPTSFSNRDSGGSTIATPNAKAMLQNRPLPPLPNETPNTFLQRKLAETREEIARRLENEEGDNTSYFNEVLAHLDQLMEPSTSGAKRTSSAPTKSPEQPGPLPVISEEGKPDGDDRPNLQDRGALTEQTTIRLADQSPAPMPIAPLNIRKRSGASTLSHTTDANMGPTVLWPGPTTDLPVHSYQGVHNDLLAARINETVSLKPPRLAASEEKKEATITKKSSWFRRHAEEKERQQENQPRHETRLKIPEAWQGLHDRIKQELVADTVVPELGPNITKFATKQSDTSSEFPMRNRTSGGTKGEGSVGRKTFLGFFGKKSKEDKAKRAMELGSPADISSSSLLSGFDLAHGSDDGSPARPPELQINWLSRFLHIKPASKVLCFQVGRGRARQDLVRLLRDWQRFGVRNVTFDRKTNVINARVDKNNHLKIKTVSLVIELFVVLEHGHRANLCLARFTQTRGAASSFRKVVEIVEDVFHARNMLVEDEDKMVAMCEVLN